MTKDVFDGDTVLFAHHDCERRFPPFLAGLTNNRHLGDTGVRQDHIFNLRRIDVFTARNNHVLDAILDINKTIRID